MLHILQFPMQIFRVSMRTVVVRKRKLRHCPFLLVFPVSVNAEKDAAQAASFYSALNDLRPAAQITSRSFP